MQYFSASFAQPWADVKVWDPGVSSEKTMFFMKKSQTNNFDVFSEFSSTFRCTPKLENYENSNNFDFQFIFYKKHAFSELTPGSQTLTYVYFYFIFKTRRLENWISRLNIFSEMRSTFSMTCFIPSFVILCIRKELCS